MHLGIKIYSFFNGKLVGKDKYGNCYFESKSTGEGGKRKRWVIYKGIAEASKVPPEWHGWLHYTFASPITAEKSAWQQEFRPNLTGTDLAYMPPGHEKRGAIRQNATGDYEAWKPL